MFLLDPSLASLSLDQFKLSLRVVSYTNAHANKGVGVTGCRKECLNPGVNGCFIHNHP